MSYSSLQNPRQTTHHEYDQLIGWEKEKENRRIRKFSQACNTSTLGGRGGWITRSTDRDHPGQHGETPSLLKLQKISWARWRVPVIPATQEAEAGELPEPRGRRLQWAETAPLHSSLGNKSETPSQKKRKKEVPKFPSWSYLLISPPNSSHLCPLPSSKAAFTSLGIFIAVTRPLIFCAHFHFALLEWNIWALCVAVS